MSGSRKRRFHLAADRPDIANLPIEEDVAREIGNHIEERTEELVASGWDRAAAREEAIRLFGDVDGIRDEMREITGARDRKVRRGRFLDGVRQDLRFAFRTFARNPLFTTVAILTLALGIGANSAIYSVVDGVLLRPLPYHEPDRIVAIEEIHVDHRNRQIPWPNFTDFRDRNQTLEAIAGYATGVTTVLGGSQPVQAGISPITRGFDAVMEAKVVIGRALYPEEHALGGQPVAMVSHRFWNQFLGGGDDLGDHTLEVFGYLARVVGVYESGFEFPGRTDIWFPAELFPASNDRTAHNWYVVGRMKPGVKAIDVQRDLDAITADLRATYPEVVEAGTYTARLQDYVTERSRTPLILLLAASVLVLLVACSNLASTMLARGENRQRELAIRTAVGAGRGRILRQLFTEGLLLALLGAAGGLLLGNVALKALLALDPGALPLADRVRLNGGVLLFTVGVSVFTALLFGLLPAFRMARFDVTGTLRGTERGISDRRRSWIWNLLVGAEVALALVLLVGSGLLIRSFWTVMDQDAGIRTRGILTVSVTLPGTRYPDLPSVEGFYARFLDGVRRLPGAQGAAVSAAPPLGGSASNGTIQVEDGDDGEAYVDYRLVSDGFFELMGIPLVEGRAFTAQDDSNSTMVAVINQAMARAEFGETDPIGRRLSGGGMDNYWNRTDDLSTWATIIGVVGDVRTRGLDRAARPAVYFTFRQRPYRAQGATVMVGTSGRPEELTGAVRSVLSDIDGQVPADFDTVEKIVYRSVSDRRFSMLILLVFAGVALLLAAVGIYGVVSYSVARRRREFGIRITLGADPSGIRGMVLRDVLAVAAIGVLAGAVGSYWVTRAMQGMLFQVSPHDPATLVAVVAGLLLVAALAGVVPAQRSTRVQPVDSLRAE